ACPRPAGPRRSRGLERLEDLAVAPAVRLPRPVLEYPRPCRPPELRTPARIVDEGLEDICQMPAVARPERDARRSLLDDLPKRVDVADDERALHSHRLVGLEGRDALRGATGGRRADESVDGA